MSGYHDSGRGGDRYAPPPRRDSSLSQAPPSGPSRPYNRPPLSSGAPPRHPSSSGYSRPYDSAPRGPRYPEPAPLHPRAYEPPPPARRPALSLWSTQNPGGRDGYHHSGQPPNQGRSYPPATQYRELDREPYDRDRDYRAPPQHSRFREGPSQRDSYQPPSGPRDSYRDVPPRHSSSSYHPSYSSPSPPTGPRGYGSYQPPPSRQSQNLPEPRSRERTPSGPALWSNRGSTIDRRTGYLDPPRGRDLSPVSSGPSRPRTPPMSSGRRDGRDDYRRTSPASSYRRDSPDRRRSDEYRDSQSQSIRKHSSNESIRTKQGDEEPSRPQTADSKEAVRQMSLSPKIPMADEEDNLTQSDIDSRIKGIDEQLETAKQRIMEIDQQSQDIQQQLKALRENAEAASQIPDTMVSDIKSEAAGDDTEEDADLTATPIDVDVEIEEKSPSYTAPPKREMRIAIARKRARPVSEIEEERENVRIRIWRGLKEIPVKEEDVKSENQVDYDFLTIAPRNELRIIAKVEDLSDHEECSARHQQVRHAMFRTLHLRKKRQQLHMTKLRRRYRQQYIVWQKHMDNLDAQRQSEMERLGLQPPKAEIPATPRAENIAPSTPNTELLSLDLSGGTRGTRRAQQAAHARDYVQSEAEFLELMASLGTEEKDPTAEIPPMLPPDERDLIYFDDTGLVRDPVEFYTRALFTVEEGAKFDIQGWLEEEDKAYMRRLSIAGKQFGRFKRAAPLQHRSVQELVQHYYFLKGDGEGLDWRSVIAGKNRYGKGAVGRPSAASVLIGSGAPGGKPKSAGRGRGRTRSNNAVPLLQPKSKDDDDDDARSVIDDDADDSGSMTAGGVRTARAKKGRVIESTAAKQRPKRIAAPAAPKEKTVQAIAPSPAPSTLEERPPSRERSIFAGSLAPPHFTQESATLMDRESPVPPGDARKRPQTKPPQTSSYWRVNEMEMFPKHLITYGKDWQKIADEMGTKTAQQVKNYFMKNTAALGFSKKVGDDSESGQSRPGTSSTPHRLEMVANPMETQRSHVESSISVSLGPGGPQYDTIPHPSQPSPQPLQQPLQPLPQPTQSQKPLPTVASLLNSPEQETVRPRERQTSNWPEPLMPTPLVSAPAGALPLPMPDFEHESRRIQSPSNASDLSRSQSRGDPYRTEMGRTSSMYASQQGIQTGPLREEQSGYYRDDPRSLPSSSRFMSSSQQNILPPVRIHEPLPGQQSPYYPGSRYDTMPPPQAMSQDSNFGRDSYPPLSPVQHRSYPNVLSPLPPPSLPPHVLPPSDNRSLYYPPREQDRRPPPEAPRDTRYPPLREEGYYPRDGRDYYRYEEEARNMRDRPFERDRMDMHPIQTERRVDRERDRVIPREREEWPRERYTESYPPRQYAEPPPPPRPRSPPYSAREFGSREFGSRDLGWERIERERMERERERERERMDYDRERWQRR